MTCQPSLHCCLTPQTPSCLTFLFWNPGDHFPSPVSVCEEPARYYITRPNWYPPDTWHFIELLIDRHLPCSRNIPKWLCDPSWDRARMSGLWSIS